MMKKLLYYLMPFLLGVAVLDSCKKQPENAPSVTVNGADDTSDPVLPESVIALLDSLPKENVNLSNVLLSNGVSVTDFLASHDPSFLNAYPANRAQGTSAGIEDVSPAEKRIWLNAQMMQIASNYASATAHPSKPVLPDQPAQTKLAYVYGSRSIDKAHSAYEIALGKGSNAESIKAYCKEKLFGIDCSGFTGQVLENAGLAGMGQYTAAQQFQEANWNNAIKNSPKNLSGVRALKFSPAELPVDKLLMGDVIFWKNPAGGIPHTGVVLSQGPKGITIYQSNGSPTPTDKNPCAKNYESKTRGPSIITLPNLEIFFDYVVVNKVKTSQLNLTYAGAIRLDFDGLMVQKVSGDAQPAHANPALPAPIRVRVVDSKGVAQKGVTVLFTAPAGFGSTSVASMPTDMNGIAECNWTLGSPNIPVQHLTVFAKTSAGQPIGSLDFSAAYGNDPPPPANPTSPTYPQGICLTTSQLQLLSGGSSRFWHVTGADQYFPNGTTAHINTPTNCQFGLTIYANGTVAYENYVVTTTNGVQEYQCKGLSSRVGMCSGSSGKALYLGTFVDVGTIDYLTSTKLVVRTTSSQGYTLINFFE